MNEIWRKILASIKHTSIGKVEQQKVNNEWNILYTICFLLVGTSEDSKYVVLQKRLRKWL